MSHSSIPSKFGMKGITMKEAVDAAETVMAELVAGKSPEDVQVLVNELKEQILKTIRDRDDANRDDANTPATDSAPEPPAGEDVE